MKKTLACVLALLVLFAIPVTAASVDTVELGPNRLLYNKWNGMPEDYVPDDMVTLYSLGITVSVAAIQMDRTAASFARAMFDAMEADGISNYLVVSGYRSFAKQSELYDSKIAQYRTSGYGEEEATTLAGTVVAVPGTSEHQSGFAIDISNTAQGGTLSGNVEKSEVGHWLMANSWRFGYNLRYPNDKTDITGIIYEPWHYRYVGAPHAQILYERGLCLEEYIAQLKDEGRTITFTDEQGITHVISYAEALPTVDRTADSVTAVAVAEEGSGYIITKTYHNKLTTPLRWM